ncbi:ABC transporter ATP-binding protein [Ruminococcus sp. NK3A76]|uniref:ABC transporter ATP-binding protein n=1 Tax=Ruminococcus sp. NK3A76 TaxID=877411 RepID=UPI00048C3907|nr:ABC transporter ATP-binding protein [Ruminococcus sp. NK3A76]
MFRLARFLKHYKAQSIFGPLFKLTEAVFELLVPVVMARMIDIGVKNSDKSYIYHSGVILVVLGVLGLTASLTAQYFAARASTGFGTELRNALFKHINSLSFKELDKFGTPSLVTRMTNDCDQVQTGVNMILRLFLRSPFIVVGAVVMGLTISVKLTLIFLIASPVLAVIILLIIKKTVILYKTTQKKLDRASTLTRETLTGARVIRAFSRQADEVKDFEENSNELYIHQLIAGKISALMNPFTYIVVNLAIIAIIWYGGKSVYSGSITQGEVIALVNYMNQILLALVALANLIVIITKAQASAVRINEVFEVSTSVSDGTEIVKSDSDIAVEFKDVSFSYYSSSDDVLEHISFSVKKGETVGIIGATGSGKSTLVNLIPRFYDAVSGEVIVNGQNVKNLTLKSLRSSIGIVPQKAVLFKGTIRENMRWRDKQATDEQIEKALEISQSLDFVKEKHGYLDHKLLQGGKNLSGGQRQRLTVARALVGSPEILILDDSSSALDLATDARLRKAIRQSTDDMTVFIVSQRISSVKNADKIIVLDDGRLAGIGTHAELTSSCDVYKEICRSQGLGISEKGAM